MTEPKLSILLIEDNTGDAILFKRAMRNKNPLIEVAHAATGEAALDTLKSDTPDSHDLIFLDLNLPTLSGMEVLKQLKSEVTLQAIPVVVLSSSNSDADVNEAYRNFASVYLVKPSSNDGYDKLAAFIDECWFGLIRRPALGIGT